VTHDELSYKGYQQAKDLTWSELEEVWAEKLMVMADLHACKRKPKVCLNLLCHRMHSTIVEKCLAAAYGSHGLHIY
jgi:hypothetical protein